MVVVVAVVAVIVVAIVVVIVVIFLHGSLWRSMRLGLAAVLCQCHQ